MLPIVTCPQPSVGAIELLIRTPQVQHSWQQILAANPSVPLQDRVNVPEHAQLKSASLPSPVDFQLLQSTSQPHHKVQQSSTDAPFRRSTSLKTSLISTHFQTSLTSSTMRFLPILVLVLTLTLSLAMRKDPPDPVCETGIRAGRACCPLVCKRCGGRRCGRLSEKYQTDCCPTSILTGARLCDKRSPPCKLTPIEETTTRKCSSHNRRTFFRTGSSPRELRKLVRRFKKLLRKRGGVRVIDWEGDAPFALPVGYYNESGVLFSSKGEYHAVSNAPKTLDDKFSSYLPEIITENFQTYSGERLFAPIMDQKLTVKFVKHGEQAAANGFGAVFVDVRKRASLKLFDLHGCVIDRVKVPRMPGGLSFVGVAVKGISKVELELGTVSISGFARNFRKVAVGDVVVLDDFVFGKPY